MKSNWTLALIFLAIVALGLHLRHARSEDFTADCDSYKERAAECRKSWGDMLNRYEKDKAEAARAQAIREKEAEQRERAFDRALKQTCAEKDLDQATRETCKAYFSKWPPQH
jgi:transketolase